MFSTVLPSCFKKPINHILKKNGVKVVSARETIAEDSTGILLESMLEGYAEFFSAEQAEKVQRGLTENALKFGCRYMEVRGDIELYKQLKLF